MASLKNSEFLTFAHQLADAAGAAIRPYFGAHGDVEDKADKSPVTLADKLAEKAMRQLIQQQFPDHAIYGEEFGLELAASSHSPLEGESKSSLKDFGGGLTSQKNPPSKTPKSVLTPPQGGSGENLAPPAPNYTWVIDPIDGTRAFIAGRKEWGTLIALCEDGVPILGILDQPVTGERWVGIKGAPSSYSVTPSNDGAYLGLTKENGPRHQAGVTNLCKTRPCATLAQAELSTTSANYFTPGQAKQVVALAQACRATVKDGDCYAYGLLARGMRDVVIDAGLKLYDILALVPIIEGAGGKITGWDGSEITLTNFSTALAVGDAVLYQEAQLMLVEN